LFKRLDELEKYMKMDQLNDSYDKNIFSLISTPEDFLTCPAPWYAWTCTECRDGCGVLAKNREGCLIKLERNPAQPVNQGKLCIRGQASLQSAYDPEQLMTPQLKTNQIFKPISFDRTRDLLKKMETLLKTESNRIKLLTGFTFEPLSTNKTEG
jgi:molybdopterin-containing oxidoreductase family iron-sulfur binding subunit